MAKVSIEKISEEQLFQFVDKKLKPYQNAQNLANAFIGATDPYSYHTVKFDSLTTDELGAKAPALLRIIASPNDGSTVAVVKFVVAPYFQETIQETPRWVKSGILVRDKSLADILSMPNRESWSEGSRALVSIKADDNSSGRGVKDGFSLQLPSVPKGPAILPITMDGPARWFIHRILLQV